MEIEQVNKRNEKSEKIRMKVTDACVFDNGDVYVNDVSHNFIIRHSPSGSVSVVFSTAPLEPVGICQSIKGEILLTLRDVKSTFYELNPESRRLVRHMTLTGDVIHEYEFQEDGRTRLFVLPHRVKQNGNSDICVVNWTSRNTHELVILSLCGYMKCVYNEQNLMLSDVECDSNCNIIVCDINGHKIHLLSPDGEFMKYLLTENEVTDPLSISLYKSTLWVGSTDGIVKVFHYNTY